MKSNMLLSFMGALAVLGVAAAQEITVKAFSNGVEVDASHISLVPHPSRHQTLPDSIPPTRPRAKAKRSGPFLSTGWCGASTLSSASAVKGVYGVYTTPSLTLRPGFATPQSAAAWVGIDGNTCGSVLLQAGTTTSITSSSVQSSYAWFEWFPAQAYTVTGFSINPGDWMAVNITTSSTTAATIIIYNESQNNGVQINYSGGPTLCRVEADWILEDFYQGGTVPFPRFADLWFESTQLTTVSGTTLGVSGASYYELGTNSSYLMCKPVTWDNTDFYLSSQN